MSLQFSPTPSEDDILMAHSAERYLTDLRVYQMNDHDIDQFYRKMFETAQYIELESSPDQQAIPITYNLFYAIWHTYVQLRNTIVPYEFQKRHRKQLIFSGASQAVMLLFGMMPSQVDLDRWTSADRTYLADNLDLIANNVGRSNQLICPRPRFFQEWRRLAKLVDFGDIIWAMPMNDYNSQYDDLREYVRRFPEEKWLAARNYLPSDLF